jgi:hypothetical protein
MFPGFRGDGLVDSLLVACRREVVPRRYPPEFRRKVLDLLKGGRTVPELARGL